MQISRGVHPEMPAQDAIRATAAGSGSGVPRFGGTKGMQSRGGTSDTGSRARAVVGAAEVFGVERDGVYQGKECDSRCRVYAGRRRNFVGQHFWARGYWVSTVGKNEAAVRRYIQEQEKEDKRLEQLELAAL